VGYGSRDRREAIRRLAGLRRRLAATEDALAGAGAAMKRAEEAFDAASDRFGAAERALDEAREERAQARRDRYAARQEHQRAAAAADRLRQRVTELAGRLDRMAELTGARPAGVTVPAPDGRRIVDVAALPGHAAGRLVGQDHAVPARGTLLGDPFDDPALAPLAADADPHGRVPGAGAPLAPADAGPGPAGVRNAHRCQYPKPCSGSRGRCREHADPARAGRGNRLVAGGRPGWPAASARTPSGIARPQKIDEWTRMGPRLG